MRWDSFAPSKRKTNLIETLVQEALVICSPGKVKQEVDCIRSILENNGYPETINQLQHFQENLPFSMTS